MHLRWMPAAEQDVRDLWDYIAQRNAAAADRQVSRIHARTEQLERHPQLGRIGRCFGTQELVIGKSPYIVAYRMRRNTIEILRILHEKRLWPRTL
jgi:addiction module RelE/StbE family toxin